MTLTNVHGLPEPFVRAVSFDAYNPGECDITVTGLLKPPQMAYLEHLHGREIVEDVVDRHWLLEGKALHYWLWFAAEKLDQENYIPERRMFMDVLGWVVSGQSDLYYEDGHLIDYKRTHTYALQREHADWEAQLNLYAHLWRHNGYPVTKLTIMASLRDWLDARAGQKDYPERPLVEVPIRLWSEDETQAFLETQVRVHQNARGGSYLPCSDSERWRNEKTGKYTRCERYCRAAPWCAQAKR
jgi:hypothetical protein